MSYKKKQKHTLKGVELLRDLANQGRHLFTLEEAHKAAARTGMKAPYVLEALSHLKHHGWIEGLKRGLYAFTPESGIAQPPHEYEIAEALVPGSTISYWTAMRFYEMTQQMPATIFCMVCKGTSTPRNQALRHITYVQVKKEYFFGTKTIWLNQARISITDPERTLLEGLRHPEYCGGFREVLSAYKDKMATLDLSKLIDYALQLEVAVAKRLGWILENQGTSPSVIEPLKKTPMKGPRKLDPTSQTIGTYNSNWQLQENI